MFKFGGETGGIKCVEEVQQGHNEKILCLSTQLFYYFCETRVSREVLARLIVQDKWLRRDHVETMDGEKFF